MEMWVQGVVAEVVEVLAQLHPQERGGMGLLVSLLLRSSINEGFSFSTRKTY
jgi:hypothetical protein